MIVYDSNQIMQSDNEFLMSEMQENMGDTNFSSEIRRMEKYSDFEKLAHETQHDL